MATTYKELADSMNAFDTILEKSGVPVHSNDRIHEAYRIVRELADLIEGNKEKGSQQRWDKHEAKYKKGEPLQALLDIGEVASFLPYLDLIDDTILKDKLTLLVKGSLNRAEESEVNNNSIARNTQFELFFYSQFCLAGYDVKLCEPNPDIKITIGNRIYFIECKRILRLTGSSINTNVKSALRQLNNIMDRGNKNHYGIVAISVQRLISRPEDVLSSPTKESGLAFVQHLSHEFINENYKTWQNPARLKNSRIVSVWVHYSGGVITKTSPPLNSLSNTTMTNAWLDKRNMESMEADFKNMQKSLRESSSS